MKHVMLTCGVWWLSLASLAAQGREPVRTEGAPAVEAKAAHGKSTRPAISDAGKTALSELRALAKKNRGLDGDERAHALEAAATAHDKVVADFVGEPAVAAAAAIAGAELWRQQDNCASAEKDYLQAAQFDAERFAQRGLLGAADMQRRQKRVDDALVTYAKAEAVEAGSTRAQTARLWQARLLQQLERFDEALPRFQSALESAAPGAQTIEAANFLALACIQKGDFDAAAHAIEHAEDSLATLSDEDPIALERLKKSIESMSARKALQRARDKQNQAGKDAVRLDAERRANGG